MYVGVCHLQMMHSDITDVLKLKCLYLGFAIVLTVNEGHQIWTSHLSLCFVVLPQTFIISF